MDSGDIAAIAKHFRACEEALKDPTIRGDRARVSELLAEDFVEFGSSGRVWFRNQVLDHMATEEFQPPAIEDFACRPFAEDVALVRYRTVRVNAATGEHTTVLRSSVWTNKSGAWLLRFHQATRSA